MTKKLRMMTALAPLALALAGTTALAGPHMPSTAQAFDLTGNWKSQAGQNQVSLARASDGYDVRAITNNADQTSAARFVLTSDGTYRFTYPDGSQSSIQVLGRDQIRITNPDGWTDVFWRQR